MSKARSLLRVACARGLSPEVCNSCPHGMAMVARSVKAFGEAKNHGTGKPLAWPSLKQRLELNDYLHSGWSKYLYTRGFIGSIPGSSNDHTPTSASSSDTTTDNADETLLHVLSVALTHPMTVAHGIAKMVNALGVDGARAKLVAKDSDSTTTHGVAGTGRVEITVVGARAEASLQLWAWQELALACHNLLGAHNLRLNFCGPALRNPQADSTQDAGEIDSGMISPLFPEAAVPVSKEGPSGGSPLTVSMRHFNGFYQDLAELPVLESTSGGVLPPLGDSTTLHCLLNPGLAHRQWCDSWTDALELLRSRTRGPIVMTSYDYVDAHGDSARAEEYFGPQLSGSISCSDGDESRPMLVPGACKSHCDESSDNISKAADVNPFRSLKFDEVWENADGDTVTVRPGEPVSQGCQLRYVQSNWSTRVYVPP